MPFEYGQYAVFAALLVGAAVAMSQSARPTTEQQQSESQSAHHTKQHSGNNKPKRKTSTASAKALAQKIAAAVIDEKSLSSISDEDLLQLMAAGAQLLGEEPARVELHAPCYVFGDIHGNLHDFLKFFSDANIESQILKLQPPKNNFLFLGDYVDRGKFSLEVIALLISLKVLFRNKITLLRGNHEIMDINKGYTFRKEVRKKRKECHNRIYKKCNKTFTKLPLCAVISHTFLCMHGGLPRPEGWDFLMSKDFVKPETDEEIDDNNTFCDLLWADPTNTSHQLLLCKEKEPDNQFLEEYGNYCFNQDRNTSILFNDRFAQEFFDRFPKIRGIIRAHQHYSQGHGMNEASTICTVFSSPRYKKKTDCGSILKVSADLKHVHFVTLKPKE